MVRIIFGEVELFWFSVCKSMEILFGVLYIDVLNLRRGSIMIESRAYIFYCVVRY